VARRLAEQLVQRRLAACVNIVGGVESVFRWKGKMQRDREVLLIAKTRAASFERLRRAVASLHPYEVPEIIAVRVAAGHRPYLRWVTLTCQEGVRHT
jgi:periplasmic divalent cation tolerance protein